MQTLRPRAARPIVYPGFDPSGRTIAPLKGVARRTPAPPVVLWLPALLVVALALLPLGYLVVRSAEAGPLFWETVLRTKTAQIVFNSALLAAAVAASTTLLAVPLAWLTTRTDLPGRGIWGALAALPIVIPSYVGALAIVAAFGPRGTLQGLLEPLGVDRLPSIYGFSGTWLTLTLFTYPYVMLAVRQLCGALTQRWRRPPAASATGVGACSARPPCRSCGPPSPAAPSWPPSTRWATSAFRRCSGTTPSPAPSSSSTDRRWTARRRPPWRCSWSW